MLDCLGSGTQVFKHLPACNLSCMLEHNEYLSILTCSMCVCVCVLGAFTSCPVFSPASQSTHPSKCKAQARPDQAQRLCSACSACVRHAEILFVSLRYFCCSVSPAWCGVQTSLYLLYKQFRDFVVYFLSFTFCLARRSTYIMDGLYYIVCMYACICVYPAKAQAAALAIAISIPISLTRSHFSPFRELTCECSF